MSKINEVWHKAHPMPARAKEEQRLDWHLAHSLNGGCRPMPRTVRDLLKKRAAATKPT